MKNNKAIVIFLGLILIGTTLSCKLFGGGSDSGGGNTSFANKNSNLNVSKSGEECPTTVLFASKVMGSKLEKYDGCTLNVKGTMWDVRYDQMVLVDPYETSELNGSIKCSGEFSGSSYSQIGSKLTSIRSQREFDKLPVATFTVTVKKTGGSAALTDCVMSDYKGK